MRTAHDLQTLSLNTIYEVSKILSSSLELAPTLRQVLNLMVVYLDMQRGVISEYQPELNRLKMIAAIGLTAEEIERGQFEVGEGITGQIFQTGIPAVIPDVSHEPLFLNRTGGLSEMQTQAVVFLGVPIRTGREIIGVMSFQRERSTLSEGFQGEIKLLGMVANLIGQTMLLHREVNSEREHLKLENFQLQNALTTKYRLDNVIGFSKRMQEVFAQVHQVAPVRSTVLLRGESGTGKEVIARSIHYLSPRKDKPFIKVNCAALSEPLLESELFGHEKGAFTGAIQERKGRFEQANGGTLFLDEIGDISPSFQVKLLRVLQEHEFERVGGNRTIKIDVRLLVATHRDLEEMVSSSKFRSDLYYRINVISIYLPPLRERREDIPHLVEKILSDFNRANGMKIGITPEAMRVLYQCQWPGNVRELENCIERFATMSRSHLIREVDIPCQTQHCLASALWKPQPGAVVIPVAASLPKQNAHTPPALPEVVTNNLGEREQLIQAMEKCGWVQAKAARLLNLTPRQMGYALKKFNIRLKKF